MTVGDAISMDRAAQPLVFEFRSFIGSPPAYRTSWRSYRSGPSPAVDRIEINMGASPSTARLSFPDVRWNDRSRALRAGTMIRIRTTDASPTVVFQGFITGFSSSFTGGMGSGEQFSRSDESNVLICHDFRWCLAVMSVISGQVARGPDDYYYYATTGEYPKFDVYRVLSGRRAVFNPDGKANMDPNMLHLKNGNRYIPIFAPPGSAAVEFWTARNMIRYILSPLCNKGLDYMPISEPSLLVGMDDSDFDTVLNNITVEGLNIIEAIDLICRHLGWSFREEYEPDDDPTLVFFKPGAAESHTRTYVHRTILHSLHAPAVGESIIAAVAAGSKMLWSMAIHEDYANVVNTPWAIGAPERFEFTAQLVPAWLDSEFVPDTSNNLANLFFTDSDLQDIADPNSKSYFRRYHARGAEFRRSVCRQWCLNEMGRYSLYPYSRGLPFDLSTVIPAEYILDAEGKRCFARFGRQLLPCLSRDDSSLNSVGIKVEFSFDGGLTWQVFPCSIQSLPDECGIYIAEPNLCEMVDQNELTFASGALTDVQLNYYTAIADDLLASRSWPDWRTRCRVTASVQTDRRIIRTASRTSSYSSPFPHRRLYDFSDKYGLAVRTASSVFNASLNADEYDHSQVLSDHLDAIRDAAQDASLSGIFVLERLWLGDGAGEPAFMIGDGLEEITGRDFSLSGRVGSRKIYPEIVRIVYLPAEQKMQLITRDLRFSEATV